MDRAQNRLPTCFRTRALLRPLALKDLPRPTEWTRAVWTGRGTPVTIQESQYHSATGDAEFMKTAIIHYWLVGMRGGEKVLEAICRLFPDADIFTHVYAPEKISPVINRHRVRTTFIGKLPFASRCYQHYLPLMPSALEQLDLRGYDLVISSESGPAKGVLTSAETPHICYCHSPMRYIWDMYQDYLENRGLVTRTAMRVLSPSLRRWDALSSLRVDYFAANSRTVAKRIHKHYRRDATVIHPPVDVDFFAPPDGVFTPPAPDAPYLYFGELVGYKRADLAVKACTASKRPLAVVGDGQEYATLKGTAGPTVRFLGRLEADELRQQILASRALIFPGEEDFGMVPVEVQAAGRPVIAFRKGGAMETVAEGKTGLFFAEQSVDSLLGALDDFESRMDDFDPQAINAHAQRFSPRHFTTAFSRLVAEARGTA